MSRFLRVLSLLLAVLLMSGCHLVPTGEVASRPASSPTAAVPASSAPGSADVPPASGSSSASSAAAASSDLSSPPVSSSAPAPASDPTPSPAPSAPSALPTPASSSASAPSAPPVSSAPSAPPVSSVAPLPEPDPGQAVFALVNKERSKEGLSGLTYRSDLQAAADLRASEIVQSFSHTRPDGTPCFTAFNVSYWSAGENIAAGYATPEAVMAGWMDSPGHRANILNDSFTGLAVGHVVSGGFHYWVQLFVG